MIRYCYLLFQTMASSSSLRPPPPPRRSAYVQCGECETLVACRSYASHTKPGTRCDTALAHNTHREMLNRCNDFTLRQAVDEQSLQRFAASFEQQLGVSASVLGEFASQLVKALGCKIVTTGQCFSIPVSACHTPMTPQPPQSSMPPLLLQSVMPPPPVPVSAEVSPAPPVRRRRRAKRADAPSDVVAALQPFTVPHQTPVCPQPREKRVRLFSGLSDLPDEEYPQLVSPLDLVAQQPRAKRARFLSGLSDLPDEDYTQIWSPLHLIAGTTDVVAAAATAAGLYPPSKSLQLEDIELLPRDLELSPQDLELYWPDITDLELHLELYRHGITDLELDLYL